MTRQEHIDNLISIDHELLASYISWGRADKMVLLCAKHFDSMPQDIKELLEDLAGRLVDAGFYPTNDVCNG